MSHNHIPSMNKQWDNSETKRGETERTTGYNLHVSFQAKLAMSLFKFWAEGSKSDYDCLLQFATQQPERAETWRQQQKDW